MARYCDDALPYALASSPPHSVWGADWPPFPREERDAWPSAPTPPRSRSFDPPDDLAALGLHHRPSLASVAASARAERRPSVGTHIDHDAATRYRGMRVPNRLKQDPNEEITTVFLAGFPEDITEREFSNYFVFAKGFEASSLKFPTPDEGKRNEQIIGFAKFRTRTEALQAREYLNGKLVDAERGCVLKTEMAKKNLHTKSSRPAGPQVPAPRDARTERFLIERTRALLSLSSLAGSPLGSLGEMGSSLGPVSPGPLSPLTPSPLSPAFRFAEPPLKEYPIEWR